MKRGNMTQNPRNGRERVLFICTHNSARSQMAEALLRKMAGDRFFAASAGTEMGRLNPYVLKALEEEGIDTSDLKSKKLDVYLNDDWDRVVTVCDDAKEACPFFPGGKEKVHKSFPDPWSFQGIQEEKMEAVRKLREEMKEWLMEEFLA